MKARYSMTMAPVLAVLLTACQVVTAEEGANASATGLEQQQDASRSAYVPGAQPQPPPEWFPEEPCSRAGGICMHANECGGELSAKPGLCPKQRAKGAECCHGPSGGQCIPTDQCNPGLRDARAADCAPGESCCILVAL